MSDGQGPMAIYYAIVAVAVLSSLIAMRIPVGKAAKMAFAWVAIFGIGFAIFSFRGEFLELGQRLRAEATGAPQVSGEEVRIPVADDGHFWVEAQVNGHSARFLVDSGASTTTLSRQTAAAAGVRPGRTYVVNTANGPAQMAQGTAERLQLGPIDRIDLPVAVNAHDDTNVLGMNFLSSLNSWRVERNYLVLRG